MPAAAEARAEGADVKVRPAAGGDLAAAVRILADRQTDPVATGAADEAGDVVQLFFGHAARTQHFLRDQVHGDLPVPVKAHGAVDHALEPEASR